MFNCKIEESLGRVEKCIRGGGSAKFIQATRKFSVPAQEKVSLTLTNG